MHGRTLTQSYTFNNYFDQYPDNNILRIHNLPDRVTEEEIMNSITTYFGSDGLPIEKTFITSRNSRKVNCILLRFESEETVQKICEKSLHAIIFPSHAPTEFWVGVHRAFRTRVLLNPPPPHQTGFQHDHDYLRDVIEENIGSDKILIFKTRGQAATAKTKLKNWKWFNPRDAQIPFILHGALTFPDGILDSLSLDDANRFADQCNEVFVKMHGAERVEFRTRDTQLKDFILIFFQESKEGSIKAQTCQKLPDPHEIRFVVNGAGEVVVRCSLHLHESKRHHTRPPNEQTSQILVSGNQVFTSVKQQQHYPPPIPNLPLTLTFTLSNPNSIPPTTAEMPTIQTPDPNIHQQTSPTPVPRVRQTTNWNPKAIFVPKEQRQLARTSAETVEKSELSPSENSNSSFHSSPENLFSPSNLSDSAVSGVLSSTPSYDHSSSVPASPNLSASIASYAISSTFSYDHDSSVPDSLKLAASIQSDEFSQTLFYPVDIQDQEAGWDSKLSNQDFRASSQNEQPVSDSFQLQPPESSSPVSYPIKSPDSNQIQSPDSYQIQSPSMVHLV
ncbi:hypothetical protein BLNAU_2343 [Blattamonas nauphoetae]|uniref:RRM domain-containing protein n=1 Tax=Blattamonas nauphoetae TaxID=2049346 RepID=A0ABQ9YFU9_9EUKA|nr:hypothetical protein BLNAU_2343 [Blattamonas nauphoetae]